MGAAQCAYRPALAQGAGRLENVPGNQLASAATTRRHLCADPTHRRRWHSPRRGLGPIGTELNQRRDLCDTLRSLTPTASCEKLDGAVKANLLHGMHYVGTDMSIELLSEAFGRISAIVHSALNGASMEVLTFLGNSYLQTPYFDGKAGPSSFTPSPTSPKSAAHKSV